MSEEVASRPPLSWGSQKQLYLPDSHVLLSPRTDLARRIRVGEFPAWIGMKAETSATSVKDIEIQSQGLERRGTILIKLSQGRVTTIVSAVGMTRKACPTAFQSGRAVSF
jgi:hypothetical protein